MQPSLNLIPTIQQAIVDLLTTREPVFLQFGYTLFIAFATILIAWHGIRMMFSHDGLGDQMFEFAKLLLFISFGYSFIAFYGMTHSLEGCCAHSVDIFIGTNYMVTFHDSALPVIEETARMAARFPTTSS